jgi:hypothetical protein
LWLVVAVRQEAIQSLAVVEVLAVSVQVLH